MRDGIFVSYAHADRAWLAGLHDVLNSLPSEVRIDLWDDTRIVPGSRWQEEIREALETATAAVLLLSPAFFGSEFIANHELPSLIAAANSGELTILPLVLSSCAHEAVTATYQCVHDPARPLETLDAPGRNQVWQRLLASLNVVAANVCEEARIEAEMIRLRNDIDASSAVAHVLDKVARAKVDPAFDGNDAIRENTLVFLEGQRCQATATWLMEEMKRTDLAPARSKAIVRLLEVVSRDQEIALRRATELTQNFANEALAMLQQNKSSS